MCPNKSYEDRDSFNSNTEILRCTCNEILNRSLRSSFVHGTVITWAAEVGCDSRHQYVANQTKATMDRVRAKRRRLLMKGNSWSLMVRQFNLFDDPSVFDRICSCHE
jgi:hypothetical protein